MNKLQSWNIITLFCILIFGFTAATLIKPDTEYSETENRTLAQKPQVSVSTVLSGEFEADYETYLTDQFFARDGWIGVKTLVERAMLRTESKDIYFAEDGYLIEKHTGAFTSDMATINRQTMQQFVQQYQEQFGDGHMTVMIVPNAVYILRDKLPAFAAPYDEETYLSELKALLPDEIWFDVGEILREHSGEEIYYRTDHHWTTLASFYVYQKWAEQQGFPRVQASDYEIETVTTEFEGTIQSKLGISAQMDSIELYHPSGDPFYTVCKNDGTETQYSVYDYSALNTKSKYDIFFGGNSAKVEIETKADNGRKLLVLKDSYAHCFVPFLVENFEKITMLDLRYYNQKLSELIADEHYTDLLVLYNASGFAEDTSVGKLLY